MGTENIRRIRQPSYPRCYNHRIYVMRKIVQHYTRCSNQDSNGSPSSHSRQLIRSWSRGLAASGAVNLSHWLRFGPRCFGKCQPIREFPKLVGFDSSVWFWGGLAWEITPLGSLVCWLHVIMSTARNLTDERVLYVPIADLYLYNELGDSSFVDLI